MAAERASSEFDRLVERWAPRPAEPSSPARADGDALALAEALEAAIRDAFVDEGTKLALALAIVEDARQMSTGSKPPTPPRVFDLVRALFPAGGSPAPADLKAYRAALAGRLDELEDLLDGLFIAMQGPAPGGAARG